MRQLMQWLTLAAVAGAATLAQAAQSDAKVPSPTARVTRQLVEQKDSFVKRMLSDSPAVKRIEGSNNAEAKQYLASAQENYSRAVNAIRGGDLAGADRQLNEATWLLGKARQLVPDPLTRDVEHRMRYAQMLSSVESLQTSYQRHLQRVRGQPPGTAVSDTRLAKVAQLIENAKTFANSEQLAQANKTLGEAEQVLMAGISRVLGTKTVEYTQRFENVSEEYSYELERNRSYADLIPIALAEFKPGSDAIREVQHRIDSNRQLREQAQQLAAKKDHRSALVALRSGTVHLQNALAAAGLKVPQDQ